MSDSLLNVSKDIFRVLTIHSLFDILHLMCWWEETGLSGWSQLAILKEGIKKRIFLSGWELVTSHVSDQ